MRNPIHHPDNANITTNIRETLSTICLRQDARKKTNGFSPIATEVVQIILFDNNFWAHTRQVIKICKPLVDAIGNLEARQSTLADCMLDLIRCARHILRIQLDSEDDVNLWTHAKSVFTREFHNMNTDIHNLALFLHPMCRRLAVGNAVKSMTFTHICEVALGLAKKWDWGEKVAWALLEDLRQYHQCKGIFSGSQADAKEWWNTIPTRHQDHPLRKLAIILHSVVPHTAEVERLFSNLGGIQGRTRTRLSVENFEKLGKL